MSLRGAVGDEAISFTDTDCFAPLAITPHAEFADTIYKETFITQEQRYLLLAESPRFHPALTSRRYAHPLALDLAPASSRRTHPDGVHHGLFCVGSFTDRKNNR
jgi:hypothetical protein